MIIPDLAEPIVGYRNWFIYGGGLLSTTTIGMRHGRGWWPTGIPMRARCSGGHDAPGPVGSHGHPHLIEVRNGSGDVCLVSGDGMSMPECGIYAYKQASKAHVNSFSFPVPGYSSVTGAVLLWGRVYEYEHGWRAEYAQPVALFLKQEWSQETAEETKKVAKTYNVPLTPIEDVIPA